MPWSRKVIQQLHPQRIPSQSLQLLLMLVKVVGEVEVVDFI